MTNFAERLTGIETTANTTMLNIEKRLAWMDNNITQLGRLGLEFRSETHRFMRSLARASTPAPAPAYRGPTTSSSRPPSTTPQPTYTPVNLDVDSDSPTDDLDIP